MKTIHPISLSKRTSVKAAILAILAPGIIASHAPGADNPIMGSSKITPPTAGTPPTVPLPGISVSVGDTSSGGEVAPGMVARIGNVDFKTETIRAMLAGLDPGEQAAMAADPAMLKRVVFSLLVEQIVMKEVAAKQFDQLPDVQAHAEQIRRTTIADMYLRTVSQPPEDYPSAAELKDAYDAHKEAFMVPHQFQISQIFIALPNSSTDKAAIANARGKLETVVKSLRAANADFAAIAHAQSDDAKAAEKGGDMGWIPDKVMPPRILAQARGLAKDAISEPIRLDDGWHIIKVINVKDIAPLAFDDVKARLAQGMRMERLQANMQDYVNKLLAQNPVTIDEKVLPKVFDKTAK